MPFVWRRALVATGAFAALFAFSGANADLSAQGSNPLNLVPRTGVTLGPEQFTFGVEAPLSNVADITYLVFAPSIDLGWGDSRTSVRANANLGYSVPAGTGDTRVFPLVGLGVYYQSFERVEDNVTIDASDTGFGVNLGAGAQVGDLVVEALIGLGDLPDLAILVGYSIIL